MSFLDHALTLITLASVFILGPAIGYAVVSCFGWQNWPVPIQHLAVGICTMLAMSGLILAYGFLWERAPATVAWYDWIEQIPTASKQSPTARSETRQPLKK
ncbi:MAG TPA: hypothetical protein VFL62_22475 [Bradyrhizobium sp.]|uniref:hypothetical protein n=1 Tax=Bradyrhizobium sp. TaxID=376 RepID=UPI002D80CAB7|nr:hypothetical protein [Bradyrhizobium sp.]HET7889003.1 hypothetical protein [Bradyrhizobium sp.]